MKELTYYNSYVEIDLTALKQNYEKVKAHVKNKPIMPVVKAECYGLGAHKAVSLLTTAYDIDIFGLAQVFEGVSLREQGIVDTELLIMAPAPSHAVRHAVEHDLQMTVINPQAVREISDWSDRLHKTTKVHIKIETGMNRVGATVGEQLEQLILAIDEARNVELVGAFTHFSTASCANDPFVLEQFELFKRGVKQIEDAGFELEYIHCCNSGSTVWLEEAEQLCTHYRPGSLFMGYCMLEDRSNPLGLREPQSWRAFITNLRTIQPGESCGYDRHFKATEPTVVATVGIGYGDGLFRPMVANGGPVMINDTKTKYLACCMDQCMVDATGIDCKIGDEVTIFGHTAGGQLLSAFDIAEFTGQAYQNAILGPNYRVKRIYTF